MTGEPKVEDLLASIRKAIDEDQPPKAQQLEASETGRGMRGTMREMRVQVDSETIPDRAESQTSRPGFSGILSGRDRPTYEPVTPQPQRRGVSNEADYDDLMRVPQSHQSHRYRNDYSTQEQDWSQHPARNASLMSQQPTQSAQMSFDRLAESLMARAGGDRTIEDITRELLRNYLRQWLDDNLPSLVERLVREEIERVARRGR